ncbi:hypothetical protein EMPG_13047 [Blastomyces silverae]|uniref:Uncharacterized protein n=1 Tax=Blastomyces silverae TaxID=2060906 RepID=A0A0H1BJX7_9EURO|nr:hypothetical protein EMPG_13047 [Blastomyces silverae]
MSCVYLALKPVAVSSSTQHQRGVDFDQAQPVMVKMRRYSSQHPLVFDPRRVTRMVGWIA